MVNKEIDVKIDSFNAILANTLTNVNQFDTAPSKLRAKSKVVIRDLITQKLGIDVCEFVSNYFQGFWLHDVFLFESNTTDKIQSETKGVYRSIINFGDVNDYRRINKFFETINKELPDNGIFINCFVPRSIRKKKMLNHLPKLFGQAIYSVDFLIHRLLPKLKLTKKLYFAITKGKGRVLTKAEVFGRLYSCGFDLIQEKVIDGKLYFAARKIAKPKYDTNPTYGPLIRLKRVGKGGKIINVYKLRTMHPYSEYLQEYIFRKNNLQKGGKIMNDFRISSIGQAFRKCWIDELPMFINFFKGDLKIIGGRPLSEHYFSLYSKELQQKRIKYKPGLIPPFYADMPETLDEIMKSEMKYLEAYEKAPLKTDIEYSIKIFTNILIKRKRSF